jgi:hypothetical protein
MFEADYPLSIALLICLLSDGNSIFQVSDERTFKFYFELNLHTDRSCSAARCGASIG